MTKEQEIFKNMKKRGRIYKAYGKFGISYINLWKSIIEAGYDKEQTEQIIRNMIKKGLIRYSKDCWGRTPDDKKGGGCHYKGKYIIEKWIN